MNSHEKRYALSRIDQVTKEVVTHITNEHYKANKVAAIYLDNQQRLDLIRKGKVSLKSTKALKDIPDHRLDDIRMVYDFSAYERSETIKDMDKLRARIDKITKYVTKVKDNVMLGDSAAAQKCLDSFVEELSKF